MSDTMELEVQTTDNKHNTLRAAVRGAYDLQRLRIQFGGRISANFNAKLGIAATVNTGDDTEDTESEVIGENGEDTEAGKQAADNKLMAKELLRRLKESYTLLTEGMARNRTLPSRQKFTGDALISNYVELVLVHQFLQQLKLEQQAFALLQDVLLEFPVYSEWLRFVPGIGPAMAGVILSEFDIYKAKYPSNMWKYCGLDVAEDGRGRGRYEEHLVPVTYTKRNGEIATRNSITFNPWLKTKLVGVLGGIFLKKKLPYSKIYYDYKHRLTAREQLRAEHGAEDAWTPLHIHRAAIRYMIKQFIIDLHLNWRRIEKLPVYEPYHEAKLGLYHKKEAQDAGLSPQLDPYMLARVAAQAGLEFGELQQAIINLQVESETKKATKKSVPKSTVAATRISTEHTETAVPKTRGRKSANKTDQ